MTKQILPNKNVILMNLGGVALHLFDDSGEFGQKLVVGIQNEQVILS